MRILCDEDCQLVNGAINGQEDASKHDEKSSNISIESTLQRNGLQNELISHQNENSNTKSDVKFNNKSQKTKQGE